MVEKKVKSKFDVLFELAYKVRHHQIRWFKYKTRADLDAAKRHERELDKLLREEERERKSGQQNLFV